MSSFKRAPAAARLSAREALTLGASLAAAVAAPAAAALGPRPGEPVAALFGPGVATDEAVRRVWRADGVAMAEGAGFGAALGLVIADADRPDFIEALTREGALVILNAQAAGAFCRPVSGLNDRTGETG